MACVLPDAAPPTTDLPPLLLLLAPLLCRTHTLQVSLVVDKDTQKLSKINYAKQGGATIYSRYDQGTHVFSGDQDTPRIPIAGGQPIHGKGETPASPSADHS